MTELPKTQEELDALLAQAQAEGGQRVSDAMREEITTSTTSRAVVRKGLARAANVLHEEAVEATKAAKRAASKRAKESKARDARDAELDGEIAKSTKAKRKSSS